MDLVYGFRVEIRRIEEEETEGKENDEKEEKRGRVDTILLWGVCVGERQAKVEEEETELREPERLRRKVGRESYLSCSRRRC